MRIFPFRKVVLFDIDGTLIYAHPVHIKVFQQSLKAVAHVIVPDKRHETISKHFGKMEKEVFRGILSEYGVSNPSNALLNKLVKANERNFAKAKKFISPKNVLPGVKKLLELLRKQNYILGAVSGNTRPKGEALLKYACLEKFIDIASFSDDKWKGKKPTLRVEIIQNAIQKIKQIKKDILPQDIIVIGDTPSDIEAGKKAGVFTIGIATGHFSTKQLKKYHPDRVLKTFNELLDARRVGIKSRKMPQ